MTDNEIIKAYEGLTANQQLNLYRNLYYAEGNATEKGIIANAINDILPQYNRQKAEIERLQNDYLSMQSTLAKMSTGVEQAKAEAIKEFAERLTTKIVNTPFGVNCSCETESYKDGCLHGLVAKQNNVLDMIYNLVKEMTEEHYETQ